MVKELFLEGQILNERTRRNINILDTIRRQGPISKTDISKLIGLNVVTVSSYIDEFLNEKLLFEKELGISEGGRRPVLLDLNPSASLAIGVGSNLLNTVGVITDLRGKILAKAKRGRSYLDVKEAATNILEIIKELITRASTDASKIEGIGLGIAGIVDKDKGSIRWPQKIDSRYIYATVSVPLRDLIEKEFNLPIIIENDATVACFGEQWLAVAPQIKNLIFMFSGVGSGIMINGDIYRGASGAAGEVSIYNSKEDDLFNCEFGSPCHLKRWEADLGITEEAKKRVKSILDKTKPLGNIRLLELAAGDAEKINLTHIFQAVKEDDPLAALLVKSAAKRLGVKAAYLINFLNPEMVIIGGGIEEAGDMFMNTLRQTVKDWAFEEMAEAVKIVPSGLGENCVALGAASLVVRNIFARG